MQRAITGFEEDAEGHWMGRLECGHGAQVRHDPSWTVQTWVLMETGLADRLGRLMECKRCDKGLFLEAGLQTAVSGCLAETGWPMR
jgi:hypothetical protein